MRRLGRDYKNPKEAKSPVVLTCSLMLKVVFDVVGLQAVHVRASLRGAVVQVVVDHVVHHIAAQPADKHAHPQDLRQHVSEEHVEAPDHEGGQARREDQAGAVERRLRRDGSLVGPHQGNRQVTSVHVSACYLVVLPVQEEVKRDEVVVVGGGLHVENKAMDAVFHKRPQEPAQQKERQEHVLVDRDGEA